MTMSATIDATIGGFNLAAVKELSTKSAVAFLESQTPADIAVEISTAEAPVTAAAVAAVLTSLKAKL